MITYDFEAYMKLLPTIENGRTEPIYNWFKPEFSFNTIMHYSGEIHLLNKNEVKPGETADVLIKMLPSKHIRKNMKIGDQFTILEGNKLIGHGFIKHITKYEN